MSKDKKNCDCLPLGSSMAVITKNYFGALTKMLEHLEIERYYTVLAVIDGTKEKCTQQYLSDSLKTDKVSMVRILDYLVKKGLIKRVVNDNDRREHIIILTSKAKKIIPDILAAIEVIDKCAMKGLSRVEQESFQSTIKRININLNELPANKIFVSIKKIK